MDSDIGYSDYGEGYLNPDLHDSMVIYSEDYPNRVDEYYDEYYIENLYLLEEEVLKQELEE